MARKPKKYHYIYKTTCTVTGKFYVGMHSSDSLDDGYLGSGKILGYSRKKYGDENHVREILEFCASRDELKQREKEIVNEEMLANPLNINLKYGGEGGFDHLNDSSLEHRLRAARGANKTNALRRGTELARRIARTALETKKRNGTHPKWTYHLGMLGKTHSKQTRDKLSMAQSKERNSQYGVKRTGISKDGKIRKVLPSQLNEFLDLGWVLGFKK